MRLLFALSFLLILAVIACAPQPPQSQTADSAATQVENGRDVAKAYCGACHALDGQAASPRADAPPLNVILRGYDGTELLADFVNGAHVGSPDMPSFNLNPAAAEDLFVYLKAIQTPTN
jgi:mono/diheme cytochrome c family protein